jgi:hypothetical protein
VGGGAICPLGTHRQSFVREALLQDLAARLLIKLVSSAHGILPPIYSPHMIPQETIPHNSTIIIKNDPSE